MNQVKCKQEHLRGNKYGHGSRKHGPSSYHMFDQDFIFKALKLKKGDCFLDLGCGSGDYAIHALDFVGDTGQVIAIDIQENVIENLKKHIDLMGIKNFKTIMADISKPLPVENNCVDVCLVSTVFHTLNMKKEGVALFKEIYRLLKPGARLVTIDCKKEVTSFGPPVQMRISSKELTGFALQCGFEMLDYMDLGHFFMIQFGVPVIPVQDNGL